MANENTPNPVKSLFGNTDPDLLRVDSDLESNGVWREHPDGFRVRIARWNNAAYTKEIAKLGRPYRARLRANEEIDTDIMMDLMKRAASRHIVRDFEVIDLEATGDGDDIKWKSTYDPGAVYAAFKDPGFAYLWQWVFEQANDLTNYRVGALRQSAKNSDGSSNGNSDSETTPE